jgi:hypothetical protein
MGEQMGEQMGAEPAHHVRGWNHRPHPGPSHKLEGEEGSTLG